MAQQKLNDDFDDLKINDSTDCVSKVLVLLIGISKYSDNEWTDLKGVPLDIANYEDLWQKHFNYDILPEKGTKWYGKKHWTEDDIFDFIEEARDELFVKKQLKYEAMIMVYCGHGLEGCVIASDGDKVSINDIHSKFGGAWIKKVTKIPRLFIFDCCRGHQKTGAIGRGFMAHRADFICSLFGNSPGIEVKENKKGGYFSQCVVDCLKKNKKNNAKLTITDLSIALLNKLQSQSNHGQICWKEGDPRVDKKIFVPNVADNDKENDDNNDCKVNIPLAIDKYNGCWDDDDYFHPRNLLEDNVKRGYMSKRKSTSGDWIIFRVGKGGKYTPKWIKIKNYDDYDDAIKDIRVMFEYENAKIWKNEQKIQNIHDENKNDQWFKLDVPNNKNKLKRIKLIIDNNHGHPYYNKFYVFHLFA